MRVQSKKSIQIILNDLLLPDVTCVSPVLPPFPPLQTLTDILLPLLTDIALSYVAKSAALRNPNFRTGSNESLALH
jgi:hypothetical protein